jgi:hypothetical protein
MHGSEANEHVFGLLRSIITDFTMLDVLRLIPKLNVRLMAACRAKNIKIDFRSTAAGYSHTYFDADDIPLRILSEFPSDQEIASAASSAFDEATALWDLLGYYPSSSPNNAAGIAAIAAPLAYLSQPSVHDADEDIEAEDVANEESDRCLLQNALNSSTQLSGLDNHTQGRLDECTYAAACLGIADQERM